MRRDVTIDLEGSLRCPEIPIFSPGRNAWAKRGDLIEFTIGGLECRGRVIGVVEDPDDFTKYLCVAKHMLCGTCCEAWVHPMHVIDVRSCHNEMQDKMAWLYGDQFLFTKPDAARQCFELTVDEMAKY